MATAHRRPSFNSLPIDPSHPPYSAWGLWGAKDELGTLNLLDVKTVKRASDEIKLGFTVSLNLPLDCPRRPMNPARAPLVHRILEKGHANDDEIHINTQASTQWDGLRHYPYQQVGERKFYNGAAQSDLINETGTTGLIGIQNIANRGIAGRGVLLDWRSHAIRKGIQYSPLSFHAIPLTELQEVAAAEGIDFRPGDILFIRSGWTEEYQKLTASEQIQLASREKRTFVGVETSKDMMKWHWDQQFAAVAGDTYAYEAWPPNKSLDVTCHELFLSGWGMPIGELFDLEQLAKVCEEHQRWTFFVTSSPLNLPGGKCSQQTHAASEN